MSTNTTEPKGDLMPSLQLAVTVTLWSLGHLFAYSLDSSLAIYQ